MRTAARKVMMGRVRLLSSGQSGGMGTAVSPIAGGYTDSNDTRIPIVSPPQPEVMVAAYPDHDGTEEDEIFTVMTSDASRVSSDDVMSRAFYHTTPSQNFSHRISNSAGGRIPTSPSSPLSTTTTTTTTTTNEPTARNVKGRGGGGGGSGSGRHRCPKCGTHVTFRHGDFEENTFYCATCSGWFLITPHTIEGKESAHSTDGLPESERPPKTQDPQILMQHVRRALKSVCRFHCSHTYAFNPFANRFQNHPTLVDQAVTPLLQERSSKWKRKSSIQTNQQNGHRFRRTFQPPEKSAADSMSM